MCLSSHAYGAITLNAGNTITVTPYWASEQSPSGANINFGQSAFGGVPMASYLILEEIASDDGGI